MTNRLRSSSTAIPTQSLGGGNPPVSLLDDDWDNVFSLPEPYTTPRGIPDDSGDGDSFVADGANLPGGKESSFLGRQQQGHRRDQ